MPAPEQRSFLLDRYQLEATAAFDRGQSVLVAAPTGAGKTVVAEHAIESMLRSTQRCIYTSPIKALANQKFRDFCDRYGSDRVGLLTGDVSIRHQAQVVVMTTEVLRNMLYEQAPSLDELGCVVFDEVHYLQDRERGPVWEEVLLNLPLAVRTVALSATISNLDEFADWLRTVRGETDVIVELERPVPLRHELAVADRETREIQMVHLVAGGRITDEARRFGTPRPQRRRDRGRRPRRRWASPRRTALVERLLADSLGPVIYFIFSRNGCDEAVEQCVARGLEFTDDRERDRLIEILEQATSMIDDDDWFGLGLDRFEEAYLAGVASHHAGLIPAAKEAVELAFAEGLIKVVFATETLALGVNLPARSVVLERLMKFDGESHQLLTPLEFTQLTGRAGRRGIDTAGTAVTCWSGRVDVERMAEVAVSRDFPLRSAFAPNYNMVANLIGRSDEESSRDFVRRSFAQFQRDRTVVGQQQKVRREAHRLAELESSLSCSRGDVLEWWQSSQREARADDDELGRLRPGAVLGEAPGSVVVSVAHRGGGVVVRSIDRTGRRRTYRRGALPSPIPVVDDVPLPRNLTPDHPETASWARAVLDGAAIPEAPGVGGCPRLDEHVESIAEIEALRRSLAKRRNATDRSRAALISQFDVVASILHDQGYARDWTLTPQGQILREVHGDTEAVLAAAIAAGTLDQLQPAELAAAVSALVYQPRGDAPAPAFRWPTKRVRRAVAELRAAADALRAIELSRLDRFLTAPVDPGMVSAVHAWADGAPIDHVVEAEFGAGDFVRLVRQIVDACRQIATTADPATAAAASSAIAAIDRGIVRSARERSLTEEADADRSG